MTDRERIAAAIWASDNDGACEWAKVPSKDQEIYLRNADAAQSAINEIAAEKMAREGEAA